MVCMHVCICMYVCMYVCIYVYVCMYVCIYVCREDIACLPYSSGTTGLPKGVMLTHYSLIANLCQITVPALVKLGPEDTLIGVLPFFHIYGMVVILNAVSE